MKIVAEQSVKGLRHVAIIMDGNGRWAAARGLPRVVGHRNGVEAVRRAVRAAGEIGLEHLTLYSFSTENWSRPAAEVRELMRLLRRFVETDLAQLNENGVRIRVIGGRDRLAPDLLDLIAHSEETTRGNDKLNLNIAFNYGGRDEILRAARKLVARAAAGELKSEDLGEEDISQALDTQDLPDPDMVVRTSGERRISNFLIWQAAYAEFIFMDVLWPDFGKDHLLEAIAEYHRRERRYGGVKQKKAVG